MSFVNAVLRDKAFWLLIATFIASTISAYLTKGLFVLVPLVVLLLAIFVWPYIELAISIIRTVKNMVYAIVKKNTVENKDDSIKDIVIDMELSFFRMILDSFAFLLIMISLIVINFSFIWKDFDSQFFYEMTLLYFFAVFIYMLGKHVKELKPSNKS
jgi:hypothetical protein